MHARIVEAQSPFYRVFKARDGCEALDVIEQEQPDLVLLDLMMPQLDGFGVLERMQEGETTRGIPVIVLTAQALTVEDMSRLNQGVAAVLGKGLFSAEETLSHIEAVLERRRKLADETHQIVRQAMVCIHERYAEPLTREDIARHVGVSGGHLGRCFRDELGVSPMTYLGRYRVNQARALLATGTSNVTEVAMAVGFSDAAYFSRMFRREVGVSPSAYRRGNRPALDAGEDEQEENGD
jgi:YesN/AraC family two-component response regulator